MQNLFSEFKPTTATDWKNQLIKDLKGESYDSLVWHNENGFDIHPFYTSENLKQNYQPLFFHPDWEINVKAKGNKASEINTQLLRSLNGGASSISVEVSATTEIEVVLKEIKLNYIHSAFFTQSDSIKKIKAYLESNYTLNELSVSFFQNKLDTKESLNSWYEAVKSFQEFTTIKTTSVDALAYHNLNCYAYYEVAIIFSQLIEHLEILSARGETLKSMPVIKAGVSSDYFIQMAKLRAIRRLWNIIKKEYAINSDIYLIVETSFTNKSISDNYNNLLRTTIESMAAVAGGCNELIVNQFDLLFDVNSTLSERMSVNQQLILKHESYLDKMADVGCGSFFIESITDEIAEKALDSFKKFEQLGGYFECVKKGVFAKDITSQAQQKEELVKNQKQISIGVNKFKNEKEVIKISPEKVAALKSLAINNPILNYELDTYFKK